MPIEEKKKIIRKKSQDNSKYPKEAIASIEEVDVVDGAIKIDKESEKFSYRVVVLKRMEYKGAIIIARKIGLYYFEYLVIYKNDLYTWNIILNPTKENEGKPLTRDEILKGAEVILIAGSTTVDELIEGERKAEKKAKKSKPPENMLN